MISEEPKAPSWTEVVDVLGSLPPEDRVDAARRMRVWAVTCEGKSSDPAWRDLVLVMHGIVSGLQLATQEGQ